MIHAHSSTPRQRAYWVSKLVASEGTYGVVSQMSRDYQVSRQTLYSWKERGQSVLEAASSRGRCNVRRPRTWSERS